MRRFNPYFHGVVAAIWEYHREGLAELSFNPYFHGVVAAIGNELGQWEKEE